MATAPSIQERKFRSLFNHLDADKNGVLSWNDCMQPAERARMELGWASDDSRYRLVTTLMRACWDGVLKANDLNQNGTIQYKEYVSFLNKTAAEMAKTGNLPPWALLDGDGITPQEYAIYLRSIGSDADPKKAFAKLDINKNGKITIDELHKLLRQYLNSNDPDAPGNYLLTGKF